jgi:hypothetical protein
MLLLYICFWFTYTLICRFQENMPLSHPYLRLIIEYKNITLPLRGLECTLYCDSQAALLRMKDIQYEGFGTTWRCRENYDIEAGIRSCLRKHEIKMNWVWVRGHAASRKGPKHVLSWPETINEEADRLATMARKEPITTTIPGHWPEQLISVTGR